MVNNLRHLRLALSNSRHLTLLVHTVRRFVGVTKYLICAMVARTFRPKVALTYGSRSKPDGVGAQIQRLLAIRSLAKNLKLPYLHTPISSVAIHPLDPYQTEEEMRLFVSELNHEFFMESSPSIEAFEKIRVEIQVLTFSKFFKAVWLSCIKRKLVLISCVEPYGVSEFDPNIYRDIDSCLPNFIQVQTQDFNIAVHIRWGVGELAIQRGEKVSRQIEIEYFVELLQEILSKNSSVAAQITIYTDAPLNDVEFSPPRAQRDLWANSSKFNEGIMSVTGVDMLSQFSRLGVQLQIVRGGDPLLVIHKMAASNILITSRSSFSYVAAILNASHDVYYPSKFWHKPLPGWHIMKEI